MDERVINNIKSLGIDMINAAEAGHPGVVLGAAPIIYTLYARHMNVSLTDDNWINRDRFVLSVGHGSAMLYSTLFLAGYDISIDELKRFRRAGSKTPGHPEYEMTPGVDVSTGPLGQGVAMAVGMAIGQKMLKSKFEIASKHAMLVNKHLFDYHIYTLCGDGCMMEGVSYEAASLAGTLKLDNLIVLYDSNDVCLDGSTDESFTENVIDRFKSMGWHTDLVKDGTNVDSIDKAITKAKYSGKPSLIEVKTVIGKGSKWAGTNAVHGKPLELDDIKALKHSYGMPEEPFFVDEEAKTFFQTQITKRGIDKFNNWISLYNEYKETMRMTDTDRPDLYFKQQNFNVLDKKYDFEVGRKESMRDINSDLLKEIAFQMPPFVGGSADLASSTKAFLQDYKYFSAQNYSGRNIAYGVREFAMGAISNGLALLNFRPFCSTFFSFADYLKPTIRMTALMDLPVTYIFTSDAIGNSNTSDGPTHQPVEQLAMLRSTPNLYVYRPADVVELVGCWNAIMSLTKPAVLTLPRQDVKTLSQTNMENVKHGAYIIKKEETQLHGIIIATGTEVNTALEIAEHLLKEDKIDLRIVSMPSMELFLEQPIEYQNEILPIGSKNIVIEAGSSFGWHRFVYNDKYLITIDKFGISGTTGEVNEYCNFAFDQKKEKIRKLFK